MKVSRDTDTENCNEHPIFQPYHLFIHTPMINAIEKRIKDLLWTGEIGCLIRGNSRDGKTRAINELKDRLIDKSGKRLNCHIVSVPRRDISTVSGLFRWLCWTIGITPKHTARADEMEGLVFNHLMDQMAASTQNQLVLFVDEMQRLSFNQIDAIASFHDRFAEQKKTLFVVFVGNHGTSDNLVDAIRRDKEKQNISRRFFRHEHSFTGIQSKDDLSHCLKQYDINRFPVDMGPTYTNFFMSEIVSNDWKLDSISRMIWHIYETEFAKPHRLSSWGMQYFIASIKTLLTHYLPKYGVENQEELEAMIFESIKSSCLIEDLVMS